MRDHFPACGEVSGFGGLYITTGHGSLGTTSTVICAQILGAITMDRPLPVTLEVANSLNPTRFHRSS